MWGSYLYGKGAEMMFTDFYEYEDEDVDYGHYDRWQEETQKAEETHP